MSADHVAPKSLYYAVFAALIVGTLLTIALTKALLVILFFMHVRWGTRLTWLVVASGFFWLLIMFSITMSDFLTRGWIAGSLR